MGNRELKIKDRPPLLRSAVAREAEVQKVQEKSPAPSAVGHGLVQLQRRYGNRLVQRALYMARQIAGDAEVDPEVEQGIQRARGGGQALDRGVRAQMEPAFEADFSGVRVHSDAQADSLNRSVNARAFTTGQDIFFRQGAYNPGSSSGRELIAHELTHVVQQRGGQVQRKLTVNQPGDRYEQEANQVAQAVMQREQRDVQRDAGANSVHRQVEEEEQEPLQTQVEEEKEEGLQAQVEEEEESEVAQTQPEKEEDETAQAKLEAGGLQRQTPEDEEAVPS